MLLVFGLWTIMDTSIFVMVTRALVTASIPMMYLYYRQLGLRYQVQPNSIADSLKSIVVQQIGW
jgi:hypothetical protein